jgi:L-arabinose isomerase
MLNVGFMGVGLNTYWSQFEGLLSRLEHYHEIIKSHIAEPNVNVVDAGIVDSITAARDTATKFGSANVDLIFIFISTYALSSTLLPVVQEAKVPVVLLNIQPAAAIDYEMINGLGDRGKMTGEWLAHCQACSLPEFACVLNKAKIPYGIVTGFLQDEATWSQIKDWVDAAIAFKGMHENTMGILGHYYNGMLDVYTDLREQSITFGTHIELLEMCELKALRDKVTADDLALKRKEFNERFEVVPECSEDELDRAARTSVALDHLAAAHNLGSMAYYYEGQNGNDYQNIVTSIIAGNTLLTGNGIPVAGECEVKNVQAMKIMSLLGAGGSFSEFYAMDFNDDVILLGHDGPAHFSIAEGKVKLVPLPVFHGKPGKGLSIQMTVMHGPVTLLSVVEGENGIELLCAEGESVTGPILQIGNTNSRYRFDCGIRSFIERWSKAGPSHHCAVGVGHVADKIAKLAFLLNIPFIQIK